MIGLPREPMIIPGRSGSGREGGHAASSRGAEELGGALSQVVVPGWIERQMRFQRHYLLSLEERLGVHFSAVDSDYDHRKRDDRLTTA
jgi:hypothetical protein